MDTNTKQSILIGKFAGSMLAELKANQHKGDFIAWSPTLEELDKEFFYHKQKLTNAILDGREEKVKEYAADLGNYLVKYAQLWGGLKL